MIYALTDPRTDEVRYVGMTRRGMHRAKDHANLARRGEKTHKAKWIRTLLAKGLIYGVVVLQEVDDVVELPEAEKGWIRSFRERGARLTNATDGGEGLLNPSDSVRKKISEGVKKNLRESPRAISEPRGVLMRMNAELTDELYRAVAEEAERQGRSLSDVVREVLRVWLEKSAAARERRARQTKEQR